MKWVGVMKTPEDVKVAKEKWNFTRKAFAGFLISTIFYIKGQKSSE